MKRIGANLPEALIEFLDKLVELKVYASRNEAIRSAVKDFVAKESNFIQNLNSDMVKLREIHRKYVEFKEDALFKLGIFTDKHEKTTDSTISIGKLPLENK